MREQILCPFCNKPADVRTTARLYAINVEKRFYIMEISHHLGCNDCRYSATKTTYKRYTFSAQLAAISSHVHKLFTEGDYESCIYPKE